MTNKQKKWKKTDGPSVEERVKELANILEEGVNNFTYSPEYFKAILAMKALMPNYTFRNLLLAKAQCPDGNFFASYKHWINLGRQVKKGAKSIKILAPRFVKDKETDEDKIIGFYPVSVFEYKQTKGEPLPIDAIKIQLEGDCPESREIIKAAERIAMKDNCPVSYGDAKDANGYYSPATHRIVVSDDLSINHRCKTLVHELVHSKVHRFNTKATRSEREVVAEGTAFIVCHFFGLDSSDYSFSYVKGWSRDNSSLLHFGSQICDISGQIIREFKGVMEDKEDCSNIGNSLTA